MIIIITTVTIAIAVFIITIRIIAISCSGVPKPISGLPLSLTPTINYGGETSYLFSQAYLLWVREGMMMMTTTMMLMLTKMMMTIRKTGANVD